MDDFTIYQQRAARTLSSKRMSKNNLAILGLGIAGEAGEVVELIKKHVGHGHELDQNALTKELGDLLWYLTAICTVTGETLRGVAEHNICKLRDRYPNGFSNKASISRRRE